mmetsp:Transcript_22938/g.58422  ORF Transcript_22938/g.58422 Transcript_22938/m.58422 type:complete len:245 (+) Transcript_22938:1098-1832(+)
MVLAQLPHVEIQPLGHLGVRTHRPALHQGILLSLYAVFLSKLALEGREEPFLLHDVQPGIAPDVVLRCHAVDIRCSDVSPILDKPLQTPRGAELCGIARRRHALDVLPAQLLLRGQLQDGHVPVLGADVSDGPAEGVHEAVARCVHVLLGASHDAVERVRQRMLRPVRQIVGRELPVRGLVLGHALLENISIVRPRLAILQVRHLENACKTQARACEHAGSTLRLLRWLTLEGRAWRRPRVKRP